MDRTIKIQKSTENELELVLTGEGHTLMSVIRKELFNDPSVIHTGYMVKHPLIKEVRFYIKTKKDKSPLQALRDALKRLEGNIDEFETKFEDTMAES